MTAQPLPAADNMPYLRDLGRAFGGALLFGLPLMMIMEMWNYGLTLDPFRLVVFLVSALPLLLGLAYFAGFTPVHSVSAAIVEVFAALAIGFLTIGLLLSLFGVFDG